MNATELLALANNAPAFRAAASRLWHEGNNAGQGFSAENGDVNDAGEGSLELRADTDTDVAVYTRKNGDVVLVGDCNGAWCVLVRGPHKVAVYAEHCLRAGEIVSRRDLGERPDSDDFVWVSADLAAAWSGSPEYTWQGKAGRAVAAELA